MYGKTLDFGKVISKIGFIGMGNMGSIMAKRLLSKGYNVLIYDIRFEAMEQVLKEGALRAENIEMLGRTCNIVFLMLLNYEQISKVVYGTEGLLYSMEPGSVIVVSSTIAPNDIRELESRASEYKIGVLDAPVSGGKGDAERGNLVIMVAGIDKIYKKCSDILFAIGSRTMKVGESVGNGQTLKAINQLLVSVINNANAEAIELAKRSGLDLQLVQNVIKNSTGNSYMFDYKASNMINCEFEPSSFLDIQIKDLDICLEIGKELGISLQLASASLNVYQTAKILGYGNKDISSIIKAYEDNSCNTYKY